jgi:hypothetical protein
MIIFRFLLLSERGTEKEMKLQNEK